MEILAENNITAAKVPLNIKQTESIDNSRRIIQMLVGIIKKCDVQAS